MTTPSPLSPAAQAVWAAYLDQSEIDETPADLPAFAVALNALADQVVPENLFGPAENVAAAQREITRREILAIAVELRGAAH